MTVRDSGDLLADQTQHLGLTDRRCRRRGYRRWRLPVPAAGIDGGRVLTDTALAGATAMMFLTPGISLTPICTGGRRSVDRDVGRRFRVPGRALTARDPADSVELGLSL